MTSASPTSGRALIWLGGLFDSVEKWRGQITEGVNVDRDWIQLKFPTSPMQVVKAFEDEGVIPGWYDMAKVPLDASVENHGCSLEEALSRVPEVHRHLDEVVASGIPPSKIVLGGFSQGGTMAILAALQYPHRLAGVVNFSGVLLGGSQLSALQHAESGSLDVLWCHGTEDKPMPQALQDLGVRALQVAGMKVEVLTCPVGHHACPAFFESLTAFLRARL